MNLRNDDRWSRLVAQTHEQRIIWADNVQKLNRSDGKVETENAVNCCDMWLPTDIGHVLLGQGCAMSLQLIPLPNNLAHIIPTTHTHTHTHMHTHTHHLSKGVPMVLVVTGTSFMVLDPKTLALKYRVELKDLKQISLSNFSDNIFIMHINPVSNAQTGSQSHFHTSLLVLIPHCNNSLTSICQTHHSSLLVPLL